jgi:hypothetical protein
MHSPRPSKIPPPSVRIFTPVSVLEPRPAEDVMDDHSTLVRIVTQVVPKKPETKEEATEMFHSLQLQLGTWLVSGLPAAEAKTILMELWNEREPPAKKVEVVKSKSCFGKS